MAHKNGAISFPNGAHASTNHVNSVPRLLLKVLYQTSFQNEHITKKTDMITSCNFMPYQSPAHMFLHHLRRMR